MPSYVGLISDNISGVPHAHFPCSSLVRHRPCFPLAGNFCRRDANGSKILCTYNGTSVCGQVILEWQQHVLLLDPKRRDNLGLSDIFAYGGLNSGYGQSGLNVHSYVKRSTQVVGHINYRKISVLKILFEVYAVIKRRGRPSPPQIFVAGSGPIIKIRHSYISAICFTFRPSSK
jgi:hypothetical protein